MTVTIVVAITVVYLGTLGTIVVLLGGRISGLEAGVNYLTETVGGLPGRFDSPEHMR